MSLPITSTRAGGWPPAMTYLAERLRRQGIALACSPDPSMNTEQILLLAQEADGQTTMGFVDRQFVTANDRRALDALLMGFTPMPSAADLLGRPYVNYWQGHHIAAAALTLWWDARMAEGHTVESATFLLELLAHPEVLSRVVFDEHDGRTRAWLAFQPVTQDAPAAEPAR
jgi:hypothetical protein